MAEVVLDWPTIMQAIEDELASVQNSAGESAFRQVLRGEPIGLPLGGPYALFWYAGRMPARVGAQTLSNVMYAARIQFVCLWLIQIERVTLGEWDADIATVDTNIRRVLRANSTINSKVTDLDLTDSDVQYEAWIRAGGPTGTKDIYRSLSFELRLDNLEGEAISP